MAENTLNNLTQIVEALVFASDEPITFEQLRNTIEDTTVKQVKTAVEALNHSYTQTNRTFHIVEVAGGIQMVTREAYAQWLKRLFQRKAKTRLSQAALETLSVIAFKQPITKIDVANIRGVNCDGVVKTLLERDLVAIGGRAESPGRPLLYKTTKEFLRYFGINSIKDLPKPKEIEELLKEDNEKPEGAEETVLDLYPSAEAECAHENDGQAPLQDANTNHDAVQLPVGSESTVENSGENSQEMPSEGLDMDAQPSDETGVEDDQEREAAIAAE